MTEREVIAVCVDAITGLFPEIPTDYRHIGQTFAQRCESWIIHALDELENELYEEEENERSE